MELLVTDSMGWTPIMIKTIINEALIHAHDDGREFLTYKDWLDAADERALGLKQPIRVVEPDRPARDGVSRGRARGRGALPAAGAPHLKATIIRRGHALGYVQQRPREERTSLYARSIETEIMVVAGRPRRREPVPRQALDRAVERPAERDPAAETTSASWPWARPSSSSRPSAADRPGHRRRARAARPALRGDRPAAPREGTGHPPPRQGVDRARRAHRRRARGGVRRGREELSLAASGVRAEGAGVPAVRPRHAARGAREGAGRRGGGGRRRLAGRRRAGLRRGVVATAAIAGRGVGRPRASSGPSARRPACPTDAVPPWARR